MADKRISELTPALVVNPADLFVLEQSGTAKQLTGQILVSWLTDYADGHGGIQTIAKTSTSGLVDTYTISYADATTSTFTVTNGAKGDTGAAWYMHIRYSSQQPTSDADMGTVPDEWMGIYSGTSATAPAHYTSYTWYKIKGNVGTPAALTASEVLYQSGASGTAPPTGEWSSAVPIVQQGRWLWTRTTLTFNSGAPLVMYTASRQGVDGEGAAGSAIPLVDVQGGAVGTSAAFAREDHQHPTPNLHITATLTTLPTTISNSAILSTMRVVNIDYGTPTAITSAVAWTTSDGVLALSGTMNGTTTADIDLEIY